MGRKCCVPYCDANYDKQNIYTSVFYFPKETERRNVWIRSINRAEFNPSSTAVVCMKHFDERFIIREDRAIRDDGSILVVPRTRLGLTSDAYPTKFINQPEYLTKILPPQRKLPSQRHKEIRERDEENFMQWCEKDVMSFNEFLNGYETRVSGNWVCLPRNNYVSLYKLQEDSEEAKITVSFNIYENLTVKIWLRHVPTDIKLYEWILGPELKCNRWTKFDNLLSHLAVHDDCSKFRVDQKLQCIINLLDESYSEESKEFEKISFLKCQIIQLTSKQPRYTPEVILWSFTLFFSYPAAYNLIRESNVMTLPHSCYLKKLSSKCGTTCTDGSQVRYLKKKASLLKPQELLVNLLLDEIYVNSSVAYKAGRLYGISDNCNLEATTIQAFMISSIFSKSKDIVTLIPVRHLTSDLLHKYASEVLQILQECGFTVLSLISDNNRVNRNMFETMSGGELKPFMNYPKCSEKKLFFFFDSVHLIKSIRNNWLNQNQTNQRFFFPNPYDGSNTLSCANLSLLKSIHESEKNSIVKIAPKLSQKVLYPTSTERQNVTYAVNLFHQTNCVALDICKDKLEGTEDTKTFIEYISTWWKIMNCKHPFKGEHFKDAMSAPIKSLNDETFIFLQKFSCWLNEWETLRTLKKEEKKSRGIPAKGGFLSKETFFALRLTTDSAIETIKYMFTSLGSSYVLLGKFQTDSLEARFGQYRQMCGGNYNVSCLQILESERKLKILSLISFFSESKGQFHLKNLKCETTECLEIQGIPEDFYDVFNTRDDTFVTKETMSVIVYLSGYIAHKVCYNLTCPLCVSLLVMDKTLDIDCQKDIYEYIVLCDRGGLKYPHDLLISTTVSIYHIFQKLISNKFEHLFVHYKEQKALIIELTLEKLELLEVPLYSKCTCGKNILSLIKQCLSGLANIFLNNYSKVRNDNKVTKCTKRKLLTLTS